MTYTDVLRQFAAHDIIAITTQAIQSKSISRQDITDFVANAPVYLFNFLVLAEKPDQLDERIQAMQAGPEKVFFRHATELLKRRSVKEYANAVTDADADIEVDKKMQPVYNRLVQILAEKPENLVEQFQKTIWEARGVLLQEQDQQLRNRIIKRINALETITTEFTRLTEQEQKEAEKQQKLIEQQLLQQERVIKQEKNKHGGRLRTAVSRLFMHIFLAKMSDDPRYITAFILQGMIMVIQTFWHAIRRIAAGAKPIAAPKPEQQLQQEQFTAIDALRDVIDYTKEIQQIEKARKIALPAPERQA